MQKGLRITQIFFSVCPPFYFLSFYPLFSCFRRSFCSACTGRQSASRFGVYDDGRNGKNEEKRATATNGPSD